MREREVLGDPGWVHPTVECQGQEGDERGMREEEQYNISKHIQGEGEKIKR